MEQYETEEQQIEAIKRFWKENGVSLVVGVVLGLGGLIGWRYYNDAQLAAKEQASFAYEKVTQDVVSGDLDFGQAKTFVEQHEDTGYAMLMGLELAKQATERKDFDEAAKQLELVASKAKISAVAAVANLRLARILIEQDKLDMALATADKITDAAFKAQSQEVKGDVYLAQQLFDKARAAYSSALQANSADQVLKMKLDNLAVAANADANS